MILWHKTTMSYALLVLPSFQLNSSWESSHRPSQVSTLSWAFGRQWKTGIYEETWADTVALNCIPSSQAPSLSFSLSCRSSFFQEHSSQQALHQSHTQSALQHLESGAAKKCWDWLPSLLFFFRWRLHRKRLELRLTWVVLPTSSGLCQTRKTISMVSVCTQFWCLCFLSCLWDLILRLECIDH